MYLRIEQDEIRFRVSQKEADALVNGQVISQECIWSKEFRLSFSIVSVEQTSSLDFDKNSAKLKLKINQESLRSELATRPSKTGIIFHQTIDERELQVSLEIDLKKHRK